MQLAPPDAALLARGTPFLRLLADAARDLGGRLEVDREYGYLGRYVAPDGRMRPIFGKSLGLNRDSAAAIAADKHYTARLLAAEGMATPSGTLIFSAAYRAKMAMKNADVARRLAGPDAAQVFVERHGFPAIVKPNRGSEGDGVSLVTTPAELESDLAALLAREDRVRVETFVPGKDYRLFVFDGRVRLGYERRGLSVTGNGLRRLDDLLQERLDTLADRHRGAKVSGSDPRITRSLARQGLTMDDIPEAGRAIAILDNANLSTGGALRDISDDIPAPAARIALQAATTLGLSVAGVDLRSEDLDAGAVVIEVNSAPGLDYYAASGPAAWDRARALVTEMLSRSS